MDFLSGFSNVMQNIQGGMHSQLGSGLTQALFGRQDRISNRDFQFMQDLADSGNPREINRQTDFLAGLAPAQGAAYNTIQDATYAQDTQRQTDRIQSMSDSLGMSPWEITGSSGAAPLPSPTGPAPQNQAATFMSQMIPLKTAEMANKTQLQIAAMNNQTSLENTRMQTDTQRGIADQATAGGKTALADIDLKDAQRLLSVAQRSQTYTQERAIENGNYLSTIETLARIAGDTTIELPGYKARIQNQAPELVALFTLMQNTQGADKDTAFLKNFLSKLPADKWAQINKESEHVAEMLVLAAGKLGTGALGGIGNFLKDLVTDKVTVTDDNQGNSRTTRTGRRKKTPF